MRLATAARWGVAALMAIAWGAGTQQARAEDTVRVGKSVGVAWTFTVLDVGAEVGTFAKHNMKLEISAFGGDARLQQAITAKNVEFGLGSGPSMGFMAKGVPAKAIAAFATSPHNIGLIVLPNSPYKSIKDLKGKKLGITTVGSLTEWLVKRAAVAEGWKVDDLTPVPLGGPEANIAALKTGQIDAVVLATEACYGMEEKGEGRIVGNFAVYAPQFHTHVIFARDDVIEKQPDLAKRFVAGFFDTIAYMKANKERTVDITSRILNLSKPVISRTYDEEITMLKDNGKFDPDAIKVIKESLVGLDILDKAPADDVMYTSKFLQ